MGINISVQYYGGFLSDIILLTQSYLRGTRLNTMHGLCTYNLYRGNYYYDLSLRPRKTQGWASENAAGQLNHTDIKMFP